MTIKEFICEKESLAFEDRLVKLVNMNAPQCIIDSQRKAVEDLKNGILKVGGDVESLSTEVKSVEQRKGRGGKIYVCFNGSINYFPQAKYGRFISVQ